jgi:DNA-binding transcriptional regulator GbsR (MarR family)
MKTTSVKTANEVRLRLTEVGGSLSRELGFGRVGGQILMYLYLWNGDCALDQLCESLRLSKAAVSIAVRQLETLGLVRRAWKSGDRKSYYRSADHIGTALRQGLLNLIRRKLDLVGRELNEAEEALKASGEAEAKEVDFLKARVKRAKVLRSRAEKVLGSPLLGLLTRS